MVDEDDTVKAIEVTTRAAQPKSMMKIPPMSAAAPSADLYDNKYMPFAMSMGSAAIDSSVVPRRRSLGAPPCFLPMRKKAIGTLTLMTEFFKLDGTSGS